MKKLLLIAMMTTLFAACHDQTAEQMMVENAREQFFKDSLEQRNAYLLAKWQTMSAEIQARRDSTNFYNYVAYGKAK